MNNLFFKRERFLVRQQREGNISMLQKRVPFWTAGQEWECDFVYLLSNGRQVIECNSADSFPTHRYTEATVNQLPHGFDA